MNHPASPSKLSVLAVSEWLLVFPATLLLTAAVLRPLQPRQFEPARTSWAIFEWTATHISRTGAAWLSLAWPALALVAGCAGLMLAWRRSETLRQDTTAVLASLSPESGRRDSGKGNVACRSHSSRGDRSHHHGLR